MYQIDDSYELRHKTIGEALEVFGLTKQVEKYACLDKVSKLNPYPYTEQSIAAERRKQARKAIKTL